MFQRSTWGLPIALVLLLLSARSVTAVEVTQAAPMRGDRLQLDLKLESPSVEQVTVQSRDEVARPELQKVKTSGGRSQIVVSAIGSSIVLPAGVSGTKKVTKPLPTEEQSFEALLIEPGPQTTGAALDAIHQWVLVVRAQRTPLRWDAKRRKYTTELIIGLQGVGASRGMSAPLSKPVSVHLTTSGASVKDKKLDLFHGGVGGFKTTVIALATHDAKATVTALSDLGEQAYEVVAEPNLGALRLEVGNDSIAGFGVGTTQVSAVRLAEDGREWFAPKVLEVRLGLRGGGNLETELLRFDSNQARSKTVEFRSAFLGESEVVAHTTGVPPEQALIRFAVPWSLFAAIALGSLLGSGIRGLRSKRSRRLYREFAVNLLSGILISVASLIGVATVLALPRTARLTEAGCLVIAAVAAYLGSDTIRRLWPGPPKPSA